MLIWLLAKLAERVLTHGSRLAHTQVTPFLLERVRSLTGGKSLQANIALVKNNARVGAALAVEAAALAQGSSAPQGPARPLSKL